MKIIHIKDLNDNSKRIDRTTPFGNPFTIGVDGDREEVIQKFEDYLLTNQKLCDKVYEELKGYDLACWCSPKRCHGEVIIKYINSRDLFGR